MRLTLALFFLPILIFSNNWKYNYSAGTSLYQGDLTRFNTVHPALLGSYIGLGLTKEINSNFDVGFVFGRTSLRSDESVNGFLSRNYSFNGAVLGGGLNLKYFKKRTSYTRILSFLSADLHYFGSSATLSNNGQWQGIPESDFATEKVISSGFAYGAGVGVGYRITDRWSLLWETKMFLTSTDYLDAFSSSNGASEYNDSMVQSFITLTYRPFRFIIKGKKERGYSSPKLQRLGCRKY